MILYLIFHIVTGVITFVLFFKALRKHSTAEINRKFVAIDSLMSLFFGLMGPLGLACFAMEAFCNSLDD